MDNFGSELKSEREQRNLSLQQIAHVTKVAPRYIEALEAGDYAQLPQGVFRRGVVRSYLSAVGLDEAGWIQRFEAALQASGNAIEAPVDIAQFVENISRGRVPGQAVQSARWLGVSAMMLFVGLLGWCLWHFVLHNRVVLSGLRVG